MSTQTIISPALMLHPTMRCPQHHHPCNTHLSPTSPSPFPTRTHLFKQGGLLLTWKRSSTGAPHSLPSTSPCRAQHRRTVAVPGRHNPVARAKRKASVSRFEEQNRFLEEWRWLTAWKQPQNYSAGEAKVCMKRHQARNPSV